MDTGFQSASGAGFAPYFFVYLSRPAAAPMATSSSAHKSGWAGPERPALGGVRRSGAGPLGPAGARLHEGVCVFPYDDLSFGVLVQLAFAAAWMFDIFGSIFAAAFLLVLNIGWFNVRRKR